jgi:hypothetical protein
MNVRAKIALVAAMTVLLCAASAQADSVDGRPTHPADRNVPASVRGSAAILFEDARGPLDSCSDDGSGRAGACGAEGRF